MRVHKINRNSIFPYSNLGNLFMITLRRGKVVFRNKVFGEFKRFPYK